MSPGSDTATVFERVWRDGPPWFSCVEVIAKFTTPLDSAVVRDQVGNWKPLVLAGWRDHLQTVGVAGMEDRLEALAADLGAIGAVRVCPLGSVPFPPPWWHHDGQGPLGALLRWMDLEESES